MPKPKITTNDAGPALPIEPGVDPTVTIARVQVERRVGWEQWFLLTSDWHFDNKHCDRVKLGDHLKECADRGGYWCSFGDTFDCMGGKWDPRSGKEDLRPEYQRGDYLDAIVEDAAAFIAPHAHRGIVISDGNHETAIKRRHETDLTRRLVDFTNRDTGSKIRHGTYQGWVLLRLVDGSSGAGNGGRSTVRIRYHHGHGGGGEVTKGVIQAQRRATYLPDADIVVSGHIHEVFHQEFTRERVTDQGDIRLDTQLHLSMSSYKDEYRGGGGYHVEKGRTPRPIGGWWVRLFWDGRAQRVVYDAVRAR